MYLPLKRQYDYASIHANDERKNLGYDYREHIFDRSVSKQLFANTKIGNTLKEIQKLIYFLIEEVKILKTNNTFAVDKDYKMLN
jgi:hypothetical protein